VLAPLQGERDAEDHRQWSAQIVGDRPQEGRLHLVDRSELGGGPLLACGHLLQTVRGPDEPEGQDRAK